MDLNAVLSDSLSNISDVMIQTLIGLIPQVLMIVGIILAINIGLSLFNNLILGKGETKAEKKKADDIYHSMDNWSND